VAFSTMIQRTDRPALMTETIFDRSPHNVQLQSLRGIAACVVMGHHALRVVSSEGWAWQFGTVVLNGHAAVVIFFVLSGYVLTQSLVRRGLTAYSIFTFYVRRAFRIFPALWVGLVLGYLYYSVVSGITAPGLAYWVAVKYDPAGFTAFQFILDVFGLGTYLLGTAWTITVELIASLVLPAIVIVLLPGRWPTFALFIALAALAAFIPHTTLLQVPFYLLQFAMGAALAIVPTSRQWVPSGALAALAIIPLLLFKSMLPWMQYAFLITLVEGFCSLIIIAYVSNRSVPYLRGRRLVIIGDWSYSIYLLHLPIAFAFGRLFVQTNFGTDAKALGVLVATIVFTVPLSAAVYRFIELPGINLGSILIRKVGFGGRKGEAVEGVSTRAD
jgi:peptidoglycan/LPS O-acetylase OafA/YrhL